MSQQPSEATEDHYILTIVLKKVEKTTPTTSNPSNFRHPSDKEKEKGNTRIVGDLFSMTIKDVNLDRIINRGVAHLGLANNGLGAD